VLNFRSIATFLGAYGAGVVTAGFFLSAPIQQPAFLQRAPDFPPQSAHSPHAAPHSGTVHLPSWVLLPPTLPFTGQLTNPPARPIAAPTTDATANVASPPVEQQQQSAGPDPGDRPNVTTTGSSAGAMTHQAASVPNQGEQPATPRRDEPSCNVSLCRRYYRSFDEETCTYQPYRGPREVCTR
jgi:hypothetical protein